MLNDDNATTNNNHITNNNDTTTTITTTTNTIATTTTNNNDSVRSLAVRLSKYSSLADSESRMVVFLPIRSLAFGVQELCVYAFGVQLLFMHPESRSPPFRRYPTPQATGVKDFGP